MSCVRGGRVFDAIEARFAQEPQASALTVESGSGAELPLDRAREIILNPAEEPAVRDAVWTQLVGLAQRHRGIWQLAALWMMLPGLRRAARRAHRSTGADAEEIDAEVVVGFLGDLHTDSLADAVHDGILSAPEAALIGRTRIEGERLGAIATQMGLHYNTCQRRRARAEHRLAGYLRLDNADPTEPARPRRQASNRPTRAA
ncbi:hypothetical protein [Actinomadura rupiterrae]|uniref:hypothetical protein n=1 Tax=Actinomadura rupiterrae TaxID=559627 RepID=UPI0020A4683B|nr:hypothetical protein [Actinomadura rupiterrae]MCP2339541.1 hypothetical protein [Actinomadura rupiterrae]